MPGERPRLPRRRVGLARAAAGVAALAALRSARLRRHVPRRGVLAARLLAVRDVAQGLALVTAPGDQVRRVVVTGGLIDLLHAGSMLFVVRCSRRYRYAAAASAFLSTGWAAAAVLASRRARPLRLTPT